MYACLASPVTHMQSRVQPVVCALPDSMLCMPDSMLAKSTHGSPSVSETKAQKDLSGVLNGSEHFLCSASLFIVNLDRALTESSC